MDTRGKEIGLGRVVPALVLTAALFFAALPEARAASRVTAGPAPGPHAPASAQPPAQMPGPAADPGREALLQTIGLLAGQGLWLGHETLLGLAVRFEKRLVGPEQAGQTLADLGRYAALTQAVFKDRLLARLSAEERRDLGLLIGYYAALQEAASALAAYVGGQGGTRAGFDAAMDRLGSIVRQISLGGRPAP